MSRCLPGLGADRRGFFNIVPSSYRDHRPEISDTGAQAVSVQEGTSALPTARKVARSYLNSAYRKSDQLRSDPKLVSTCSLRVRPATVGASNRARSGNFTPNAALIWETM